MTTNTVLIGIVIAVCILIGAILWPYSLNTWLIFFDKEPTIKMWHGALLGFCPIIGQVTIPVAVVTWILMIFLT